MQVSAFERTLAREPICSDSLQHRWCPGEVVDDDQKVIEESEYVIVTIALDSIVNESHVPREDRCRGSGKSGHRRKAENDRAPAVDLKAGLADRSSF